MINTTACISWNRLYLFITMTHSAFTAILRTFFAETRSYDVVSEKKNLFCVHYLFCRVCAFEINLFAHLILVLLFMPFDTLSYFDNIYL